MMQRRRRTGRISTAAAIVVLANLANARIFDPFLLGQVPLLDDHDNTNNNGDNSHRPPARPPFPPDPIGHHYAQQLSNNDSIPRSHDHHENLLDTSNLIRLDHLENSPEAEIVIINGDQGDDSDNNNDHHRSPSNKLLNRSKRIIPHYDTNNDNDDDNRNNDNPYYNHHQQQQQNPYNHHNYGNNDIDDSRPIYVTDDGEDVSKVHSGGPWGPWSGPGECSRSCGGGVAQETRVCTDQDESVCSGPSERYHSCNTHACGDRTADFRAEQCSAYNNVPFEGRFYTWIPYSRAPQKCELNCMPQGERFYYRHKRKVIDGTACGQDHVCVNGNCLPVGCDGVLGSRKRQDKCRVCGGDGSTCNTVQGVFDSNDLQVGYNDVLLIPAGATNIVVRETQATNNYLAIRNTSGHYYLNGNWRIDFPREIPIAGTTFHYERKPHTFFAPETIRALGPISEAIYVVVLYQESNPGITFEYSVPRGVVIETEHGTEYAWIYDEWGTCSRECGGGSQSRNVNCARRSSSTLNWDYVEPHLCDSGVKPETFRYCNYEIACPVKWHVSTWDDCTAPCGSDIPGTQYRNVFCEQEIQGVSALVENEKCELSHGPPPDKLRNCTSTKTECTDWFIGTWKGCSHLCGDGYDTRVVRCVSKDELGRIVIHGDEKCVGEKPKEYEYCFQGPCDGVDWVAEGSWGECKVPAIPTCDSPDSANQGTQSREVYCSDAKGKVYDEKYCHAYRKPPTTQSCKLDFSPQEDPSCKWVWYATQWTDCQFLGCSEMSKGKRTRKVFCGTVLDEDGAMTTVDDENCNATKKYGDEEECVISPEEVEKNCGDEEARLRKGRWFGGPWGECSKPCAGGRRTRAVLCMLGNRSTTDVKICGEDDVLFTSEDCNTFSCDAIPEPEPTDGSMVTGEDGEDDGMETGATEEEFAASPDALEFDALQFTEEPYTEEPYTEEDEETSTMTEEPCEPLDEEEEDYYYYDDEEEGAAEDGDDDMVTTSVTGRSTRSITTTEMMMMVTDETGDMVTESAGAEDDVTMETGSGDGATGAATEESSASDEPMMDGVTEGTAVSGMTTSSSGSTPPSQMSSETTTAGSMMTTTTESVTTTTTMVTTTTEPPTTTTEAVATTTTEPPTTTTMPPSTTTPSGGMTTTTMHAGDMTTVAGGVTPDGTTVSGATSATTPKDMKDFYDDLENDGVVLRMMASSESSLLETGATDMISGAASEMMGEADAVTEVEYLTDYITEMGFTTLPTVTLPKCKPKPRKPKPPSYCHKSAFGCCPDKESNATGPFHAGCVIAKTCTETKYGCCDDGVTVAEDKRKRNCVQDCKSTLFGCCPDGKGVAQGNNAEGCVKDCNETQFGCCLDGKTAKKGPKGRNCPKIPCSEAIYGCCPDKKRPALGPDFKSCPEINLKNCKVSFFGCCIDGTTTALGPDEEGCPDTPPCVRTEHGCCPDGVTSAHGPNNKGCCATSRFGCCPDNINEALGPDFLGCTCASSPYGCCPDNTTPARGPNQDCGCKFTEHGCCPDGVSEASGANYEGCACSTFQFGCCPDGISVAKGPNDQGCGCAYTEHGCCPDNRTPKNSSSEPCGCESSLFGCCPDGETHALGKEFEGCEDVPIKPGEVCGLDKERGACRNFTVRWYFDQTYGGCSRFWWGGCGGNLNKFATQDECRSVCVEPEGRDACYLPRVSGPCEGYYPSWFYDPVRERCEQFIYSGCLGNNNRFETRQECENNCLLPERVDDCDQPRTEGPCRGNYSRWYYDKTSEKCDVFTYGGCKGNSNNFLTEKECHQRCGKDVRMRDVCFQPRSEGPCNEKLPRWYYDGGEQRCVPFYYSGCQGNSNRFAALDECEKTCPAALLAETHGCLEPRADGECASYTERYYFDRYEGRCKSFIYSGCGGNTNNFISVDDCRTKCETFVPRPVASSEDQQFSQAHCFIPPPDDPTPCNNENAPPTIRWYYNSHDGVCDQFRYYCSNGSLNNFDTRQDCEDKCGNSQDFCTLPVVKGRCSGSFLQYYYDRETDSCQPFEYSGCSGNGNRFDTVVQCEQRCKQQDGGGGEGSEQEGDHHHQYDPYHPGYGQHQPPGGGHAEETAEEDENRRRYEQEIERRRQEEEDHRRRQQEEDQEEDHHRRRYEEEAERRRLEEEERAREDLRRPVTQEDICVLPVEQGPCRAAVKSYHYDARERKCVEFLYGGCGGNANRFESEEMCERQCGEFRGMDVCNETPDPGPCTSDQQKSQKWYFNTNDQGCAMFVYSGCGGNGNRFSTRDECESVCQSRSEIVSGNDTITGAAICRLAPDTGPCVDGFKRWYYNPEDRSCLPFVFGGCSGNLNRFKSFETCVNFCEKALGYTYRERSPANSNQGMVRSGDGGLGNSGAGSQGDPGKNYYYSDDTGPSHHSSNDPYNAPCDCSFIKCPYGLAPQNATYSCTCECHDPCATTRCHDPGTRCSVDIHHGHRFVPVCRSVRKPGSCPNLGHHVRHQQHHQHHRSSSSSGPQQDRICDNECSSDADCAGDLKCCMLACGSSCVVPVNLLGGGGGGAEGGEAERGGGGGEITVMARNRNLNVSEGGLVEMECTGRGSPRPDLMWVKVDGNEKITGESGRFRIKEHTTHSTVTSTLQIAGPHPSDAGEYSCIGSSPHAVPVSDQITLDVHEASSPEAASVLEDPTLPTTQIVDLGQTANLRCFALGWPRPSVTWWRGERMLPFSSERYEQMRDHSLVIRLVSLRDLGVYTCQAYNGLGRAASWSVSLLAYGPVQVQDVEDREFLVYVVDTGSGQVVGRGNYSRPGVPITTATTTTTTTAAPRQPPPSEYYPPYNRGYEDPYQPPSYPAPLRTSITMDRTQFSTGSEIRIPCVVEGYNQGSEPTITWYFNDSPIDLVTTTRRHRYEPPALIIPEALTTDTGTYRCSATSDYGMSSSEASTSITVDGVHLHVNCTDNSFFANCKLIVKANYCTNKYYARFCCKSCTLAGQLPAWGPHLQDAGQAYFRRGSGPSSQHHQQPPPPSSHLTRNRNNIEGGGADDQHFISHNNIFN